MSSQPTSAPHAPAAPLDCDPIAVLGSAGFDDYALLDSGAGRKLERFGRYVFDRPEPQALWQPGLEAARWLRADAVFKSDEEEGENGRWRWAKPLPETWPISVMGITALCRLSSFHHLGIFPEQCPHWEWMAERIAAIRHERPRVLNLFAYTGVASLIAARLGAEVTHVDASKKAIAWAKANQNASRLDPSSVRWILDDARKFTAREVRRGRTYHVVLVDPPKFGRGPIGEVWDLFPDLPPLLRDCQKLLAPRSASLVLTCYAIRASALSFGALMHECLRDRDGRHQTGELVIRERSGGRLLATSLYSRWSSDA